MAKENENPDDKKPKGAEPEETKAPKKPKRVKVKNALNQPLAEDGVVYPPANQKLGEDGKPLPESARVFEVTPERREALGACVADVE